MTLLEIYRSHAEYVLNSGYRVVVDTRLDTVWITNGVEEQSWFLQGQDASEFIAEAERIWAELQHITRVDMYLALAKPYIDSI